MRKTTKFLLGVIESAAILLIFGGMGYGLGIILSVIYLAVVT